MYLSGKHVTYIVVGPSLPTRTVASLRAALVTVKVDVLIRLTCHLYSGGAFTADTDCGVTKGCFSDCESGCTYQVNMSLIYRWGLHCRHGLWRH